MDCRQLFGSRGSVFARLQMEMKGGQGLEATLKLNPSTLYRQWEQHRVTELHLIQSLAREGLMQALLPVWGISENAACECGSVLKAAASVNNNAHHTIPSFSCPCRFTGRSWKIAVLVEQFSYIKEKNFFSGNLTEEIKFTYWRYTGFFW